jgi:hypothetical protein
LRVEERLNLPHEVLDNELTGTTKGAWATWRKNTQHTLGGYIPS